jgi:hypothetical protein
MEFRASLSGECDVWIVSGDAKAEFKVKSPKMRAKRCQFECTSTPASRVPKSIV